MVVDRTRDGDMSSNPRSAQHKNGVETGAISHDAYSLTVDEVLKYYQVDMTRGLTPTEADNRRQTYGKNELSGRQSVNPFLLFLSHIFNVLTSILFIALGLSLAVQEWVESCVIGFVIIANAVIGFIQEYRSEQTMQALRQLSSPVAKVMRGGQMVQVPASDLVPGDIIHLEEGDQVPADVRLLSVTAFTIDEAILTGESVPVEKTVEPVSVDAHAHTQIDTGDTELDGDGGAEEVGRMEQGVGGRAVGKGGQEGGAAVPVGDRVSMAFLGCVVTKGRAVGVVAATGMHTELGKIAKGVGESSESSKTHLQRQLDKLALGLFGVAVVLGFVVVAVNNFSFKHEVLLYAIALGVAIIPESLVAVTTVTLSIGVKRMAKGNTIVRKLVALEALGSVTDICSDKTGTLTLSQMTATRVWLPPDTYVNVTGSGLEPTGTLAYEDTQQIVHTQRSTDNDRHDHQQRQPRQQPTGGGGDVGVVGGDAPAAAAAPVPPGPRQHDARMEEALMVCALCNASSLIPPSDTNNDWSGIGDPTELALAVLATKAGMDKASVIERYGLEFMEELPFDSTIKRMSVIYRTHTPPASSSSSTRPPTTTPPTPTHTHTHTPGHATVYTKGAFESVFNICTSIRVGDMETQPLHSPGSPFNLDTLQAHVDRMASNGLRVLALACRDLGEGLTRSALQDRDAVERDMIFLGLVGLMDPPRPETLHAVQSCLTAGIRVRMVTGDHPQTATYIAREVQILDDGLDATQLHDLVMPAPRFDGIADPELDRLPQLPRVVARCSPDTKVKLIRALHRRGKVVAMTGDGVNDAPSLKAADVGVAMGKTGSDVTKQAADIVLTDDNFATIEEAVKEGRRIGSNIVKFVCHLMAGNVAEVLMLVIGLCFLDSNGYSVYCLSPLQILWLNMVTGSPPALGLAYERAEEDVMRKRPVEKGRLLINRLLFLDTLVYGCAMGILGLLSFVIVAYIVGDGVRHTSECNHLLSQECEHLFRARSTAFGTIVLLFLVHAYNCKNLGRSTLAMNIWDNKVLLSAVVFVVVTLIPTFYIPVVYDTVFYQAPISWEWGIILGNVVVFWAVSEAYKKWVRPAIVRREVQTSEDPVGKRRSTVHSRDVELVIDSQ